MIDWKLYYGNNTTFSSDDGSPEEAPARDIQVVSYIDTRVGKVSLKGADWYIYRDGSWFGTDEFGLLDQLVDMNLLRRSGSPVTFEILLNGKWQLTERPNIWFDILELGIAKAGRWVSRQEFHDIYLGALNDPEMPTTSALETLNSYSQTETEKQTISNPVAPYAGGKNE